MKVSLGPFGDLCLKWDSATRDWAYIRCVCGCNVLWCGPLFLERETVACRDNWPMDDDGWVTSPSGRVFKPYKEADGMAQLEAVRHDD